MPVGEAKTAHEKELLRRKILEAREAIYKERKRTQEVLEVLNGIKRKARDSASVG